MYVLSHVILYAYVCVCVFTIESKCDHFEILQQYNKTVESAQKTHASREEVEAAATEKRGRQVNLYVYRRIGHVACHMRHVIANNKNNAN